MQDSVIRPTNTTALRLVSTDSDKKLSSVSNLADWIAGTLNRLTVTNDGDGTVTLDVTADYTQISSNDAATNVTGAELEELTDGSFTTLHKHKLIIATHSTDTTLATSDLGKIHIIDTTSGACKVTLPSVDSTNVAQWVIIGRKGVNTLNVHHADSDKMILATGTKLDNHESRYLSFVSLVLYEEDYWGIGNYNFGVWNVR